jgi:hypothetical protein
MTEERFDDLFPYDGDPLDDPPASKAKATRRTKRQAKLFAQLPIDAFQALAARATCPLLAVILELDRLVVTSFRRSNKVNLSNFKLGELGVSQRAKARALRLLEEMGLITVEKATRRAPTVTVLWRA